MHPIYCKHPIDQVIISDPLSYSIIWETRMFCFSFFFFDNTEKWSSGLTSDGPKSVEVFEDKVP